MTFLVFSKNLIIFGPKKPFGLITEWKSDVEPEPEPTLFCTNPDPSINMQKSKKTPLFCDFFLTFVYEN
jgi:hypothetical protein